jgi:hypothetical protein
MPNALNALIRLQAEIVHCRRVAAEMPFETAAKILFQAADEAEARAREIDATPGFQRGK